jgi:hypothetical protein
VHRSAIVNIEMVEEVRQDGHGEHCGNRVAIVRSRMRP